MRRGIFASILPLLLKRWNSFDVISRFFVALSFKLHTSEWARTGVCPLVNLARRAKYSRVTHWHYNGTASSLTLSLFATFPSHLYLVCHSTPPHTPSLICTHLQLLAACNTFLYPQNLSPPFFPHLHQPSSLMIWKYSIDVKKNPSNFTEYCGLNVRRVKENGFTTEEIEPFYSMRIHPRTLNLPQRVYATELSTSIRRKEKNKIQNIPSYHATSKRKILTQTTGSVYKVRAEAISHLLPLCF